MPYEMPIRFTRSAWKSSAAAIVACSVLAVPAHGQQQGGSTAPPMAEDTLNLPANVTILSVNPNLRRATAKVNGQVITGTDIDQRMALVLAANENPNVAAEEVERLRQQVLSNLIDETLQIQEAEAQEVEIDKGAIDTAYARVASQNFGQNVGKMDEYLTKIGSSPQSLKRQIQGELAWQRLLQRNVQPFVNVSEEEVKELLQRLEASKGTDEYRLGEIYLAAPSETKQAVYDNARRIVDQVRQGGSFVAYARQFSEASTAAVGGDLGWIRLPVLPAELQTVAREMQPGQLVGPVEVPGGFSILYLIDKRQVLSVDPRDAVLSLKQVSLDFPAAMTKDDRTKLVDRFNGAVAGMKGCGDAEAAATPLGATVVANDQIRARALPDALQRVMLELNVGQATPVFGSIEEGVRVLLLCGRDDPEDTTGPTAEQLMAQLEEDRVNKRAQRYLRDLRRDAVIQYDSTAELSQLN
jgi:peptidyl-prolyl cis-trans isomerase SurA